MSGLKAHPFAEIFPLIEGADFEALVADIRAKGLRSKIVLYEGMILDGRNRFRACEAAGVPADFEAYRGTDPLGFVLSLNLSRRHLNETQRALVAAKLETLSHGGARSAPPADAAGKPHQDANLHLEISRAKAAELLHVSPRSVASAKEILSRGDAALVNVAMQGKIAVSAAAAALAAPVEVQRAIADRAQAGDVNAARIEIKKAARSAREQALGAKQIALPQKKYGLIYADPEWREEVWSRETGLDRAPENHYPTSSVEDICKRDVRSIAADNCVLALWRKSNNPHHALQVMTAWGFEFRAEIIWDKGRIGPGRWFRNKHEALWIGVRGNVPAPAPGTQWESIIEALRSAHSAKPERFAEMLEAYFPTLPKIELNRRGPPRPGWDAWGNEAEIVRAAQ